MDETLWNCPYLGMAHDPETKTSYPSVMNCCLGAKPVEVVALSYQKVFCLTGKYKTCPVFMRDSYEPLPRELRASQSQVSKPWKVKWYIILAMIVAILALVLTMSHLFSRNQSVIPNKNSSTSFGTIAPQYDPDRLVIPAINLDAPIEPINAKKIIINNKEFTQYAEPDKFTAGWYINSAKLGQIGNTVISGRYSFFNEFFSKLEQLEVGNPIRLLSGKQTFNYIITNKISLQEKNEPPEVILYNARWILPSNDERITLVTCWLFNSNNCLIIVAAPSGGLIFKTKTSVSLTITPMLTVNGTDFPVLDTPQPLLPPNPTATSIPTNTPVPAPTDTGVPIPTDTDVPVPTDTPEPPPTDTPVPVPTDTPEPPPTDTPVPPPPDTPEPPPTDIPPEPTPE